MQSVDVSQPDAKEPVHGKEKIEDSNTPTTAKPCRVYLIVRPALLVASPTAACLLSFLHSFHLFGRIFSRSFQPCRLLHSFLGRASIPSFQHHHYQSFDMSRSLFLSTALLALRAVAQTAEPYTDEKTGIAFSGFHHSSGYKFGIALPENPTTDFIAQVQAPITNGDGWAGFSMGQSMTGNLLVVAWPNEGEIVSSFRLAT
jgi:hypothetical protein